MQHGVTGKQYPSDCHNLLLINITSPSPQTPQGITIFHAISHRGPTKALPGFQNFSSPRSSPCANYKFIYWLVKCLSPPLRAPINIGESAIRSESSTLWYLSHWWNIYTKPFKGFSPKPFPVTMFNLRFDTGIFDQYAMITIRNALSKYKNCKQLW